MEKKTVKVVENNIVPAKEMLINEPTKSRSPQGVGERISNQCDWLNQASQRSLLGSGFPQRQ